MATTVKNKGVTYPTIIVNPDVLRVCLVHVGYNSEGDESEDDMEKMERAIELHNQFIKENDEQNFVDIATWDWLHEQEK